MPCNSDYLEASEYEISLSRVACLIDEFNGVKINKSHWDGYHPRVYNNVISKREADRMVSKLCDMLKKSDVSKFSLEMQMWWRDHQEADKKRIEKDAFSFGDVD